MEKPARNLAVDAYRGFVMLLMMAEVVQLSRVAKALPGSGFWNWLAYNQTHVEWAGCSLHDTIQPGFSFLVGVALPYSIAARIARGGGFRAMTEGRLWSRRLAERAERGKRAVPGVGPQRNDDAQLGQEPQVLQLMKAGDIEFCISASANAATLSPQAGVMSLQAYRPPRWQWAALGVLLFGYWLAWALYPAQQPGFFSGFLAHWNKGNNFGNTFDVWFLNLFPCVKPYVENSGGYLTLSFIPTLGTMILGLAAGQWLRATAPAVPMRRLLALGGGASAGHNEAAWAERLPDVLRFLVGDLV